MVQKTLHKTYDYTIFGFFPFFRALRLQGFPYFSYAEIFRSSRKGLFLAFRANIVPEITQNDMKNLSQEPTQDKVRLLWEALESGCSQDEARIFSRMTRQEFASYFASDPNATSRLEEIKYLPLAEARVSLRRGVNDDPSLALKVLERKDSEMAPRSRHELTGKDGEKLFPVPILDLGEK